MITNKHQLPHVLRVNPPRSNRLSQDWKLLLAASTRIPLDFIAPQALDGATSVDATICPCRFPELEAVSKRGHSHCIPRMPMLMCCPSLLYQSDALPSLVTLASRSCSEGRRTTRFVSTKIVRFHTSRSMGTGFQAANARIPVLS